MFSDRLISEAWYRISPGCYPVKFFDLVKMLNKAYRYHTAKYRASQSFQGLTEKYPQPFKLELTPSDFQFLNQNVLAGAILFFWNQYSNIVRTKLSSTALTVRVIIKK